MNKILAVIDKAAIGFSLVCAIHCAAAPIAVIILPAISSTAFGDETFHLFMLWLVLPTSVVALAMGCRKHRSWRVASAGIVGLAILVLTAFLGHDLFGENGEKIVTLIGAGLIAYGHFLNYKLCWKLSCHP